MAKTMSNRSTAARALAGAIRAALATTTANCLYSDFGLDPVFDRPQVRTAIRDDSELRRIHWLAESYFSELAHGDPKINGLEPDEARKQIVELLEWLDAAGEAS